MERGPGHPQHLTFFPFCWVRIWTVWSNKQVLGSVPVEVTAQLGVNIPYLPIVHLRWVEKKSEGQPRGDKVGVSRWSLWKPGWAGLNLLGVPPRCPNSHINVSRACVWNKSLLFASFRNTWTSVSLSNHIHLVILTRDEIKRLSSLLSAILGPQSASWTVFT